jgi:hypothetical protein
MFSPSLATEQQMELRLAASPLPKAALLRIEISVGPASARQSPARQVSDFSDSHDNGVQCWRVATMSRCAQARQTPASAIVTDADRSMKTVQEILDPHCLGGHVELAE